MASIIQFPGKTLHDIDPDLVVDNAPRGMQHTMVIGRKADGQFYFATSSGDLTKINFLLDWCKKVVMDHADGD